MATSVITSLNPNLRPSIINFRDWAFAVDGNNIPRYFDQNSGYWWMHLDPTTALTSNETGAGAMTGIYRYIYTEYNKNSGDGDFHSGHESNPMTAFTTGDLVSKQVVLTLPATVRNTGFTHFKIYRTDAGGTYAFYYIGNVAVGTTTFTDNNIAGDVNNYFGLLTTNADGDVTAVTYLNYPIGNYKYIIASKTRIFAFGIRIYDTGTVTTNGTTTVTGSGTAWTRAMEGSIMYINNGSRGYVISTVASTTSITLAEAYAGASAAGQTYTIEGNNSKVTWCAKHPITAKPMWWAFPSLYYRIIRRSDDSQFMGGGLIGDQPVVFKQRSHYLLTEDGNDYIDTESNTKVGTCSHWAIVSIPDNGGLMFPSYEGRLYITSGVEATDLLVDFTKLPNGINMTYAEKMQAIWYPAKKWYMCIYPSEGQTYCDKILVYDFDLKEYVIFTIRSNCIALVELSESGQTVWKPYIGTIGGFVYKTMTGNNLGASSGTLTGTSTAIGAATLADSTATFYTTADGLKDVYIQLYDTTGEFKEEQKISSNTANIITVDTNWTSSPAAGWTYDVGGIRWWWKSKVFDFDQDASKVIRNVLLNFKKESSTTNVRIKMYFSEDSEIATTENFYINFDLSQDYYEPLSLYFNRARYFQFEIWGHGTAHPVTISSIIFNILENAR